MEKNMKPLIANIGLAVVSLLLAGALCGQAGDLAVNNATVQGDLQLHAPDNLFNVAVRYRISDEGTQTRVFADSDRTLGAWWWRSRLSAGDYRALMVLEGGEDQNSSLWLYDDGNVSADIRLAAKGDSFFNAGRLGLGTSTPSEKLEVAGTVKASGLQLTTAPAAGHVLTSDANGVASWQELPAGGSGGSGEPSGPAGGDLAGDYPNPTLAVNEGSLGKVSGNAMVSTGGRIGIGTSNPDSELHVVGRAHISQVLRLQPSARPGNPERGDIYFDGDNLWIYTSKWRRFQTR